jgi:hypothetical protein
MHMIVEAILTRYSVSSEILMVKVGDGDPPVEPNAAGETCDKKQGKQQCTGDFAGCTNQEDSRGAQDLEKQTTVTDVRRLTRTAQLTKRAATAMA